MTETSRDPFGDSRGFDLGTACRVDAGTELTTEGAPGRTAFVVVEGTARVTRGGRLLGHVGPDDFVGDMAFIDHGPHAATVVAESPMRLLAFDAALFSELLDDPSASRALRHALVARLRIALDIAG